MEQLDKKKLQQKLAELVGETPDEMDFSDIDQYEPHIQQKIREAFQFGQRIALKRLWVAIEMNVYDYDPDKEVSPT